MSDLNGKVALVSALPAAFGAAIAQAMVDHGAKIVFGDVLDGEGQALAEKIGPPRRGSSSSTPHLVWLTGFKNRVLVLAHWTTAFLTRGRAERAITEQQVFGRQALAASVPRGEVVD